MGRWDKSNRSNLRCLVPGCRKQHPAYANWAEWLCHEHWKSIPEVVRTALYTARRKARRDPGEKNLRELLVLWEDCKKRAISNGIAQARRDILR